MYVYVCGRNFIVNLSWRLLMDQNINCADFGGAQRVGDYF